MECGVQSVKCKEWSVEREGKIEEWRVGSVESVKCKVWSVKCGVWIVKCGV